MLDLEADAALQAGVPQAVDLCVEALSAGNKILYIEGVADETSADVEPILLADGGMGQDIEIYAPQAFQIKKVAAWARVISPGEVAGLGGRRKHRRRLQVRPLRR